MKKKWYKVFLTVLLCSVTLMSCSDSKPEAAAPDPEQIAGISAGEISRTSSIRVQFVHPIGGEKGTAALENPFNFSPEVQGNVSWLDPYTLEFTPAAELKPKTEYTCHFSASGNSFTGIEPFSFSIHTPPRLMQFGDARLGIPDVSKPDVLSLEGTLHFSDIENPEAVAQALRIKMGRKQFTPEIQEDKAGKSFTYTVSGITKTNKDQELQISASGIEVEGAKEELRFLVPDTESFDVLSVIPRTGDNTCIEVVFSQPLSSTQDLTGLISADTVTDLQIVQKSNMATLYSSSPWPQRVELSIHESLESQSGIQLVQARTAHVVLPSLAPQARFVGDGVIVPTSQGTNIALETMNLTHVMVEAIQIHGTNVHQFLQLNQLDGNKELHRVGSVVWRRVIDLDWEDSNADKWMRYGLDLTPLLEKDPSGIFQLRISFKRPHVRYRNMGSQSYDDPVEWEEWPDGPVAEADSSSWDYYQYNYDYNERRHRNDPTHVAYYKKWSDHDITAVRNVMFSDIGIIAKQDDKGRYYLYSSDLKSTRPIQNVAITIFNYQQKNLASVRTDRNGMAIVDTLSERPFFLVAEHGSQYAYMRLDSASMLSMSHFDISGVDNTNGLDGFVFGERGVWRPGDTLYLTLILRDPQGSFPDNHPVLFKLIDPRGNVVHEQTLNSGENGFYGIPVKTQETAVTGLYTARFTAGDRNFDHGVRIETVMPNRLKIDLKFEEENIKQGPFKATLSSQWLHGANAANLKADIRAVFSSVSTVFNTFSEYSFEDPSRSFNTQSRDIFNGTLNEQGEAEIQGNINISSAPGKLAASFTSRVFEPGGSFSVEYFSKDFHPYDRYIGLKTPKGDVARGMLLTDTDHPVELVLVDKNGTRLYEDARVKVELFKLEWRWWWETNTENIAQYFTSHRYNPLQSGYVSVNNGTGVWQMRINYPDWGRYFIRVTDESGGHSAGKIVYIDWPGWAGRAQDENSGGANMLALTAEKSKYKVGERAVISIPSSEGGRILVNQEVNGQIIASEWLQAGQGGTQYSFTVNSEMVPNVYIHATHVQAHLQTMNDRPIRSYGLIPIMVEDPANRLSPKIDTALEYRPGEDFSVRVSEENGQEMTYTLAVVDEGLLGLTRYAAPNPYSAFFRKTSSRLKHWDLYNFVAGAYSGRLGTLLAIGGGDEGDGSGRKDSNRFPPVVFWSEPVTIRPGQIKTHTFSMPQYVGAVRVMLVAGNGSAYGKVEKEIPVRQDLMVLGTVPRVLGPNENITVPVSVFSMSDALRGASISVTVDGAVSIVGQNGEFVRFPRQGEYMARFQLESSDKIGPGRIRIRAEANGIRAEQHINLTVREPQEPVSEYVSAYLQPGKTFTGTVPFNGIEGTNKLYLEASTIPPMDLTKRLGYLVRYPHGCVEQVTSSVFPQVYLDSFVQLTPTETVSRQKNIEAAIEKLQGFQTDSGGFSYWPGGSSVNEWGTNYAGHFLLEAKNRGFAVPGFLLDSWLEFQKSAANSWTYGNDQSAQIQAYRLYLLALAKEPDLGAMNRLAESRNLVEQAAWRLSMAYSLSGRSREANNLVRNLSINIAPYLEMSGSYGSDLRDKGMILEALVLLNDMSKASRIANEISRELTSNRSFGTQTTAYALLGMFKFGISQEEAVNFIRVNYTVQNGNNGSIFVTSPAVYQEIPMDSYRSTETVSLTNQTQVPLMLRLVSEGIPMPGSEQNRESNLGMTVQYRNMNGIIINPASIEHGEDIQIEVTVRNPDRTRDYENLALSYVIPAGWELHNTRLEGVSGSSPYTYQDFRDDRVYTYFDLASRATKKYIFRCTAAYKGTFYHPLVSCEAMYDGSVSNVRKGFRTEVK